MTTTTSAAPRLHAAGVHALSMPADTQSSIILEVFGTLAMIARAAESGADVTPGALADLMDRALADGIGKTLRQGDRVSLEVNDLGGTVVGTVHRVSRAIGEPTVIDVELPDGRIFPQSARFVKPVAR